MCQKRKQLKCYHEITNIRAKIYQTG